MKDTLQDQVWAEVQKIQVLAEETHDTRILDRCFEIRLLMNEPKMKDD